MSADDLSPRRESRVPEGSAAAIAASVGTL